MDLYETLGVAKDATKDAIKKAFRRRARETHPDVGGEPEKFHAVELAHRVLTDDERRAEYDATGRVDDQVDTVEAQALSIIGGLVERLLDDERAKYKDLAAEMRKSIKTDIETAKKNREEGEHYRVRTENLRTKFSGKGAKLVDGMIARRVEQAKAAIASLDKQIEIRERALAMLDDLSFEPDKEPHPTFVNSPFFYEYDALRRQQNVFRDRS